MAYDSIARIVWQGKLPPPSRGDGGYSFGTAITEWPQLMEP